MLPKHRPNDEIPTASMADVAFLLVVYFMVILTFAATKGLDFAPPRDDTPELTVDPVESVLVEVDRGGRLVVDQRPMHPDEVIGYLAPRLEANPDKPIILRPLPEAAYGDFVTTFDLLRRAGRELGLGDSIQIAIPTEREIATFWS